MCSALRWNGQLGSCYEELLLGIHQAKMKRNIVWFATAAGIMFAL